MDRMPKCRRRRMVLALVSETNDFEWLAIHVAEEVTKYPKKQPATIFFRLLGSRWQ